MVDGGQRGAFKSGGSKKLAVTRGRRPAFSLNKIKPCRRVATRYDKIAANDLAFIQLLAKRLWLRAK
jgi:transposase